jgi:hypothetical protein
MTRRNEYRDRFDRIDATLDQVAARLDRLSLRHQALRHTLRIAAYRQAENAKRVGALGALRQKNEKLLGEARNLIDPLAHNAEAGKRRRDTLEG